MVKDCFYWGERRFTGLVTVITTAVIMMWIENCKATKVLKYLQEIFWCKINSCMAKTVWGEVQFGQCGTAVVKSERDIT